MVVRAEWSGREVCVGALASPCVCRERWFGARAGARELVPGSRGGSVQIVCFMQSVGLVRVCLSAWVLVLGVGET